MDYAEYYYDEAFKVTKKGDKFDLSDTLTTNLTHNLDIDDTKAAELETKFIDEMYGTEDAKHEGWARGAYTGLLGNLQGKGHDYIFYGLDLERTFVNEDGNEITNVNSHDYYQELTRGEVDWGSYADDDKFKKVYEEYQKDSEKKEKWLQHANSGETWAQYVKGAMDTSSEKLAKVQFIRHVNATNAAKSESTSTGDTSDTSTEKGYEEAKAGEVWQKGKWPGQENREEVELKPILDAKGNPTGRHDLWIKPRTGKDAHGNVIYGTAEKQETVKERYADGKNRLAVGFTGTRKDEDGNEVTYKIGDDGSIGPNAYDAINQAPQVVKPLRLSSLKIENQVRTPHNIPKAWDSHIKQTIKAPTTKAKVKTSTTSAK